MLNLIIVLLSLSLIETLYVQYHTYKHNAAEFKKEFEERQRLYSQRYRTIKKITNNKTISQ